MSHLDRRTFSKAAALSLVPLVAGSHVAQADATEPQRIRVGQIGTRHAHALGKLDTVLKMPERFELVGIAEPDARRRAELQKSPEYQQLRWMETDELLAQPGLQLVLVETEIDALLTTAERCVQSGLHIHLDKPAGASLLISSVC